VVRTCAGCGVEALAGGHPRRCATAVVPVIDADPDADGGDGSELLFMSMPKRYIGSDRGLPATSEGSITMSAPITETYVA